MVLNYNQWQNEYGAFNCPVNHRKHYGFHKSNINKSLHNSRERQPFFASKNAKHHDSIRKPEAIRRFVQRFYLKRMWVNKYGC